MRKRSAVMSARKRRILLLATVELYKGPYCSLDISREPIQWSCAGQLVQSTLLHHLTVGHEAQRRSRGGLGVEHQDLDHKMTRATELATEVVQLETAWLTDTHKRSSHFSEERTRSGSFPGATALTNPLRLVATMS